MHFFQFGGWGLTIFIQFMDKNPQFTRMQDLTGFEILSGLACPKYDYLVNRGSD